MFIAEQMRIDGQKLVEVRVDTCEEA